MRKQLAQSRPSDTNAASVLTGSQWEVDLIIICNVGSDTAGASLYHDADGSTYDESTAILFNATIDAGTVVHYEPEEPIANSNVSGNLAVKSGTASGLTFTVYGKIYGDRV